MPRYPATHGTGSILEHGIRRATYTNNPSHASVDCYDTERMEPPRFGIRHGYVENMGLHALCPVTFGFGN